MARPFNAYAASRVVAAPIVATRGDRLMTLLLISLALTLGAMWIHLSPFAS